jgi:hypothetical protein
MFFQWGLDRGQISGGRAHRSRAATDTSPPSFPGLRRLLLLLPAEPRAMCDTSLRARVRYFQFVAHLAGDDADNLVEVSTELEE